MRGLNMVNFCRYPGNVMVIQDFFEESHIDLFFDTCFKHIEKNPSSLIEANSGQVINMLFEEIPSLKNFFDTEELRSCLSKATGCYIDDIVISQHSDFHVNTLGGWHNDIDGKNYCTHEEAIKAKIFKFGIFKSEEKYMKSIGTQFFYEKKYFIPELKKGDILIFPVGINHRGYPGKFLVSLIRKFFSALNIKNFNIISFFRRILNEPDRSAIFFTFGKNCPEFKKFETNNIKRAKNQQMSNKI